MAQIEDRYNHSRKLKVNEDGSIDVNADLTVSDIEIGAVEIKDGTTDTRQTVKSDGVNNASVVTQNSQPLPTGASTESKQDDSITHLATIASDTTSLDGKDFATETTQATLATASKQDSLLTELQLKADLTETQPVSITSLPLPEGGATSANQDLLLETKVDTNEGDNIRTSNVNTEQTLTDILKEMKIMNLHLAILTDNTINKTEVE